MESSVFVCYSRRGTQGRKFASIHLVFVNKPIPNQDKKDLQARAIDANFSHYARQLVSG